MPKLTNIELPKGQRRRATLTLDGTTAELVRQVARIEGRAKDITSVVNDMLVLYVETHHRDLKLTYEE